jgi:hypothetical protein
LKRSLAALSLALAIATGAASSLLAACGPFADVAGDAFCPFVLEIFYLGITTGTTATTYDPTANVSRLQMAAFLSRTVDGALRRGSRRAAMDQFWTPKNSGVLGITTVGASPFLVACDGADVWAANFTGGTISRVRGSDGKLLETWTAGTVVSAVQVAMGRVFVTSGSDGKLFSIDPSQPAGAVTTVASDFPVNMNGIAFDGSRVWTANNGSPFSVSIVTPGPTIPWTATTVTAGFAGPWGLVFDGSNMWLTDRGTIPGRLLKLDSFGAILQTVTLDTEPRYPVFDGTNIWVPNLSSGSITVVRASSGAIVATLTGNDLQSPYAGAFDGQRLLFSNQNSDSVTLWKAADLSPLGSVPTGPITGPAGVCSDGVNFWVALTNSGKLARF